MRSFRLLFFVLIGMYIAATVFVGLPVIHSWHDPLVFRDTGTIWTALSWNIREDRHHSIPVATFCHIEGPLQILFLNVYYHLVGAFFPLDPITTQIPHAILVFLCAVFFYWLGKKIQSDKFGYFCAVMFVVSPWVAFNAKQPQVVVLFSVLFELATFYFYISYILNPEWRWYRIAAPLSLAFYLTVALDWPSFLFILLLFLLLNKKLSLALKNPYNSIPIIIMLLYLLFSIIFYVKDIPCSAFTIFFRAFGKVLATRPIRSWTPSDPSLSNVLIFVFKAFGLAGPLSLVGIGLLFFGRKKIFHAPNLHTSVRKNFFTTMGIWLLLFSLPLFISIAGFPPEKSQFFLSYSYVIVIPLILLAALVLSMAKKWFLATSVVCIMIWSQWYAIITIKLPFPFNDDDRRIVAAATFLIEQRPDLLNQGKIALLAGDHAKGAGQYARGQNWIVAIHVNFPKFLAEELQEEKQNLARRVGGRILLTYTTQKKLNVDWLILTPELLSSSPENQSFEFYQLLAADPQINWIACFQDVQNRKLWIGEVKPEGTPIAKAAIYDVEPLADIYQHKYNRINFLKRNIKYLLHF